MAIRYVWEKYSVKTEYKLTQKAQYSYALNGTTKKTKIITNIADNYLYEGTGYTINSDGTFTLTGTITSTKMQATGVYIVYTMTAGKYYTMGSSSNVPILITVSTTSSEYRWALNNYSGDGLCANIYFPNNKAGTVTLYNGSEVKSQGTTNHGTVMSTSSSAYPTNGLSGSYWYVYKGIESINYVGVSGAVKQMKAVVRVNGATKTNVRVYQGVNGAVKQS